MHITTETRVGIFILLALGAFAYMTFQIGVFRFDRARYALYHMRFKDIAGLSKKADVKIAGVKVGWVDKLRLLPDSHVEADVMILKDYDIHSDAYAVVRQDGLLGNKYLEIVPGDPLLPVVSDGTLLTKESREAVSVDDILHQVQLITYHVEDITHSLREVLGGDVGALRLEQTIEHVHYAAEKLAGFADGINRFMVENQEHLNHVMQNMQAITGELRHHVPQVGQDLHDVFTNVSQEIIPEFSAGVHKISGAIDRDFNHIASKIGTVADSLDEASLQVRDGFKNISEIAVKINEGEGLIGKLINDDEAYRDIKASLTSMKNYFAKLESLVVVVDAWSERMCRDAFGLNFKNGKGYFNFRIYPNEDHYWLVGLTASNMGVIDRNVFLRRWFDEDGCEIIPSDVLPEDPICEREFARLRFAREVQVARRRLDQITFNVQFAKIFTHLAFRFGLFESSAGVGIDYDIPIPFYQDTLRWIMTLEAWDFNGRRRIGDERLHLKWLNRIFFTRNLYMTFGADDFVSKHDKNAFFGVGIRFIDDDIKYLFSRITVCL